MSHQVVQVKRERVASCITCPICNKLFREATTIIECLHTYVLNYSMNKIVCRKCIYKKLLDEEVECCPVCNTNLGCTPLEKLRPDHNLQDVRAKIFPSKRVKVKTPEPGAVNPVTLPIKRKEKSLSQLVVNAPRVAAQSAMTGRRSKSKSRKASRGSSFTIEKPRMKEDDSTEDHTDSASSPETLNKFTQTTRLIVILNQSATTFSNHSASSHDIKAKFGLNKDSTANGPSSDFSPDEGRDNGSEQWDVKANPRNPLNCLVEVANRSKSSNFSIQGSVSKSESLLALSLDNNGLTNKSRNNDLWKKSKALDVNNGSDHNNTPLESERPKKLRRVRKKKAMNFGDLPQDVIGALSAQYDRKKHPIWFSLVASDEQEGDSPPLPHLASSYLRIKDGSIPVSFIHKYLKIKLDLSSEDEVEIKCMGQTIIPTLSLSNLVDLWLQMATTERESTTIGASAKGFMMVLG